MPNTEYVETVWTVYDYELWGNAEDGFEVNYTMRRPSPVTLRLPITRFNVGTENEFSSAEPTDDQLRALWGISESVDIIGDGDDVNIYVYVEENREPLGELHCESHSSLSPIRTLEN